MEGFVRDYGTGNLIPDPPAFVNYQTPDAIPSSSARPTSRPAQFTRSTNREVPIRQNSIPVDDEPVTNTAGVGAGGGLRRTDTHTQRESVDLSRQPSRISQHPSQQVPYTNGTSRHQSASTISPSPPTNNSQAVLQRRLTASAQSAQLQRVLQDPHAETIDPTAETYIKVGNNAYKVDLSKDPQKQPGPSARNGTTSPTKQNSDATVDPLMKHLEELQNTVSTTGSGRRNTLVTNTKPPATPEQKPGHVSLPATARLGSAGGGSSSLAPITAPSSGGSGPQQNRAPTPVRHYQNPAQEVVGAYPSSRPASPQPPPTAAFMVPKPSIPPSGSDIVSDVVADYQQSLPGEHKSIGRDDSNSRANTPNSSLLAQSNQGQNLVRPPSQLGHAGIGAHGSRSNSPQPQPVSRGPSPASNHVRNSFMQPPNPGGQGVVRAPSPNAVGIALDPTGRVLHDEMAQRYQQQQQHVSQQLQRQTLPPQTQHPAYNPPPPPTQQQHQQQLSQRRASYVVASPVSHNMAAPVAPVPYAVTPPPNNYHTPSPQPSYTQPPAPLQPGYNPSIVQYQPPAPQQQQQQHQQQPRYQQQQQPPPQQLQPQAGYNNVNIQRNPSLGHYNGPPPPQQQVQQVQQPQQILAVQQQARMANLQQQPRYQQQPQQPQYGYHDPASTQRSPSPVPAPQATEDSNKILFYGKLSIFLPCCCFLILRLVKALYDYSATIEEEFDFQAGDIIAVTATPDDGWWSGELLDENRRQKGRNVFPSNFVCLF